jgi:hypothetical protein
MREALAWLAVSTGRSEIRIQPLRSSLSAPRKWVSILPDLMPHLAAPDVLCHTLRYH